MTLYEVFAAEPPSSRHDLDRAAFDAALWKQEMAMENTSITTAEQAIGAVKARYLVKGSFTANRHRRAEGAYWFVACQRRAGRRDFWAVDAATGRVQSEADVPATPPQPQFPTDPLIAKVIALVQEARPIGVEVTVDEAEALLRVIQGPAHCGKCGYRGAYGVHMEPTSSVECTSFASYHND